MPLTPSKPGVADRLRWGILPDDLHKTAFRAVTAISDASPEGQVFALAAALRALCGACHVNPGDILGIIDRADRDLTNVYKPQLDALRDYARGEWK